MNFEQVKQVLVALTGVLQIMQAQAATVPLNESLLGKVGTNTFTIENPLYGQILLKDSPLKADVLSRIAICESGGRQFNDDGTVLRGKVNPKDIGRWQINETYNGNKAKELGFDVYTSNGNAQMASWLYDQNGTKDWNSSKFCWNK